MKIKEAKFITSVASSDKFLKADKPIIAVAGKSNVGKSSFINMLANIKKLAKTSNTPGRTRLVNYFDFGEFILADLPGYGFAKVSKQEQIKWGKLMQDFFETSDLAHTIVLVDIRHNPTAEDKSMVDFLYKMCLPFTVVTTKADKLSKTRLKPTAQNLANQLSLTVNNVIITSSQTAYGKAEVLNKIEQILTNLNTEE